jgi:hypothetical protein
MPSASHRSRRRTASYDPRLSHPPSRRTLHGCVGRGRTQALDGVGEHRKEEQALALAPAFDETSRRTPSEGERRARRPPQESSCDAPSWATLHAKHQASSQAALCPARERTRRGSAGYTGGCGCSSRLRRAPPCRAHEQGALRPRTRAARAADLRRPCGHIEILSCSDATEKAPRQVGRVYVVSEPIHRVVLLSYGSIASAARGPFDPMQVDMASAKHPAM